MSIQRMRSVVAIVAVAGAAAGASGQVVPVSVVARVGDVLSGGATISSLGSPFTNSLGQVGFQLGTTGPTARRIWIGNGPVFDSTSNPLLGTGAEDTMGISDAGGWIYSPALTSAGAPDAVVTNNGVLLAGGDAAPGEPGRFNTFNSRPRMVANGSAFWMAGSSVTAGGSSSNRAFLRNTNPANPAATTLLYKGGDTIAGLTLSTLTSNFTFDASDNANNTIHEVGLALGGAVTTANDTGILRNGSTWVMREGDVAAGGNGTEVHQNFGGMGINNAGNFVVAGDTNNANTAQDHYIAYNGTIELKEGQSIGSYLLNGPVDAISINNNNLVAFLWDSGPAKEGLFVGTAGNLINSSLLLQTGDLVDIDGDTIADFVLQDFNAAASIAPGLDLSDNGNTVFVNVDLRAIGGTTDIVAIIGVTIPAPGSAALLGLAGLLAARRRR